PSPLPPPPRHTPRPASQTACSIPPLLPQPSALHTQQSPPSPPRCASLSPPRSASSQNPSPTPSHTSSPPHSSCSPVRPPPPQIPSHPARPPLPAPLLPRP